jgi:hypothetical protein
VTIVEQDLHLGIILALVVQPDVPNVPQELVLLVEMEHF